jgi:plasmid stabilization system protein ParE
MGENENGGSGSSRSKERSPNYPALTLSDAVRLVEAFWKKERRTTVSPEAAARAFDYKSLSGPARQTIATLRQYGLLESDSNGVRISELGITIVHHPAGTPEGDEALRTAAMNPPLIRELAASHAEASDDALKIYLVTKKRFSDDGARRFIRAFRDAIKLANLPASGYNEIVSTTLDPIGTPTDPMTGRQLAPRPRVTVFSWPLSKGVTAEVRFVGEEVGPGHLERLRQYLELAKDAVGDNPESLV